MSWIQDIFGRIFTRSGDQQKEGSPILGLTGKPLNPLYRPREPRRDEFAECGRLMDKFMRGFGYKKFLSGDDIPRPKRRFLKKSERMEPGDVKIMAGVSRFKK